MINDTAIYVNMCTILGQICTCGKKRTLTVENYCSLIHGYTRHRGFYHRTKIKSSRNIHCMKTRNNLKQKVNELSKSDNSFLFGQKDFCNDHYHEDSVGITIILIEHYSLRNDRGCLYIYGRKIATVSTLLDKIQQQGKFTGFYHRTKIKK